MTVRRRGRRVYCLLGMMLSALGAVGAAIAHHATQVIFDVTKRASLTGLVTKVAAVNPHPYIYLNVTDNSGQTVEWEIEGVNLIAFRRAGVLRAIKPGTKLVIDYWPARDKSHSGFAVRITSDEGKLIYAFENLETA